MAIKHIVMNPDKTCITVMVDTNNANIAYWNTEEGMKRQSWWVKKGAIYSRPSEYVDMRWEDLYQWAIKHPMFWANKPLPAPKEGRKGKKKTA